MSAKAEDIKEEDTTIASSPWWKESRPNMVCNRLSAVPINKKGDRCRRGRWVRTEQGKDFLVSTWYTFDGEKWVADEA